MFLIVAKFSSLLQVEPSTFYHSYHTILHLNHTLSYFILLYFIKFQYNFYYIFPSIMEINLNRIYRIFITIGYFHVVSIYRIKMEKKYQEMGKKLSWQIQNLEYPNQFQKLSHKCERNKIFVIQKQSKKNMDHEQDYQYNHSMLTRRCLMIHGHTACNRLQSGNSSFELKSVEEELKKFPQVKGEDWCVTRADRILGRLDEIIRAEGVDHVTGEHILQALRQEYRDQIVFAFVLMALSCLSILAFTFSFQSMIEAVVVGHRQAYLLILLTMVLNLVQDILDHNYYYENACLVYKAKQPLIYIFYQKATQLTSTNLSGHEISRIINSISSDFSLLETQVVYIMLVFRAPFKALGVAIYLVAQLTWVGILPILGLFLVLPIHMLIGRKSGQIVHDINVLKDQRIKLYSEIIDGIRFIKIYGWEHAFSHFVKIARNEETREYLRYYIWSSIAQGVAQTSVFWAGYLCYVGLFYSGNSHVLSSVKLLATMQSINGLKIKMSELGVGIPAYYTLSAVFERFAFILNMEPVQMKCIDKKVWEEERKSQDIAVQLSNFRGFWKDDSSHPTLNGINLTVRSREFYGIMGKVGSGKSSLLNVVLEELPYYSGSYQINGKVAFVEQEPILFSDTLKENVLFKSPLNEKKYLEALTKSCLATEVKELEHQDSTFVGEKGIALSGGQRVRLSLARALYADPDIYVLDDPFAALDSKVAREVYEKAILPLKGRKTVLLVTHHTQFLEKCDKIIVMEKGKIIECDSPSRILSQQKNIFEYNHLGKKQESLKTEVKVSENDPQYSIIEQIKQSEKITLDNSLYLKYFFYSKWNWLLFLTSFILFLSIEVFAILYFEIIARYDNILEGNDGIFQSFEAFWICLGIFQIIYFFLIPLAYFFLNLVIFNSNSSIHEEMVEKLIRSHLYYFDIVPSGELTSKFSNDITTLDSAFPVSSRNIVERIAFILVIFTRVLSMNLLFLIPLILGALVLGFFFLKFKKQIIYSKKIHLLTKAPIFKYLKESIVGVLQIRILQKKEVFLREFASKINNQHRTLMTSEIISRSLGFYVTTTSLFISFAGLFLAFINNNSNTIHNFGIQAVFLLQINMAIGLLLRKLINNQSQLVSAQRALTITKLKSQKDLYTEYDESSSINLNEENREQPKWPSNPTIKIQNLKLRYRSELPLILKGIQFKADADSRVAIVGRTGAGKSSIFQALLRMYEPEPDSVYEIGGYNVLEMGLHSLRKNISVIPQTPFLVQKTIRQNLDPLGFSSDEVIWKVLESTHLKKKVESLPSGISTSLLSGSEIFSAGEKQLFCLARVLLQKNKILLLDEATSNVDGQTDRLIQNCIREQFSKSLVITVAHRLNTIIDYDKVIVIGGGKVAQSGSPSQLIQKKGLFYQMLMKSSEKNKIFEYIQNKKKQK